MPPLTGPLYQIRYIIYVTIFSLAALSGNCGGFLYNHNLLHVLEVLIFEDHRFKTCISSFASVTFTDYLRFPVGHQVQIRLSSYWHEY